MPATSGVTVNMNLGLLDMEAANGIGAKNAFLKINAQQIVAQTDKGDIFMEITGKKAVALDAQTLNQGDIHIRLTAADTLSAQLVAQGLIDVAGLGSLTLTPESRLESKGGSIEISSVGDLMLSGTTLIANEAVLKAGQAINALDSAQAPAVSISGDLRLEAVTGIGDFGYGRFLVNNLNTSASVSAYNEKSGDVVLAGVNGLRISEAGVVSAAVGDTWVALLGGSGTLVEQGQVVARSNQVIRLMGTTWMPRPSASQLATMASDALNAGNAIRSGVRLGATQGLDLFNGLMERSFTLDAQTQIGASNGVNLGSRPASVKVLHSAARSTSTLAMSLAGIGFASSPQSTAQLLDMAMAVVQQNPSAVARDMETLGNWVSRTAPTVSPAEAAPVAPAPAPSPAVPSTPPGAVEARPEPSAPAPTNDGGGTAPTNETPPPANAPNSGVQWLLPAEDVAAWTQGLSQPVDQGPSEPNPSGLMGAVAKLGQWLGWGGAGPAEPPDPG